MIQRTPLKIEPEGTIIPSWDDPTMETSLGMNLIRYAGDDVS